MTETAQMADVVLPATMFMEHDDVYQGGGHQYIMLGPKLIEPPGECRSNHEVICALAKRVGAEHPGFAMTRARADRLDAAEFRLGHAGASSSASSWIDCQPDFETAHYIKGFACPDGKFRFKPDWPTVPFRSAVASPGRSPTMPALPDHWDRHRGGRRRSIRSGSRPRRRAASSIRPSTRRRRSLRARSGRPTVMIHPDDAATLGIADGDEVVLGNTRGAGAAARAAVRGRAPRRADRGIDLAERRLSRTARGINTLTGADAIAPYGGAAFHDNKVWIRPAARHESRRVRPSIRQRPSAIRTRPSATSRSACG